VATPFFYRFGISEHNRGDVVAMHKFVDPFRTFAISAGSFFASVAVTLIVISALAACAPHAPDLPSPARPPGPAP